MKFYQFPNNNCFPTVCYFSREKPLVKPTAPGSLFIIFAFAFIFRSIKPKIQKYLAAIYLFCDLFILSTTFTSRYLPILRRRTQKGLTTPLTRRVASICYLCRCHLCIVSWFPYWFDNLGFITEGNTYRRCAASSLPLWGNTDEVLGDIRCHD